MDSTFVTTVMASYLGDYAGCAKNRESKFVRAVNSFIQQGYMNKRLIIVSDGCEITERLYKQHFADNLDIKLVKIEKQELFSGNVRQAGLDMCDKEVICYMDTDDFFVKRNHISIIAAEMSKGYDWVYYNESIGDAVKINGLKDVSIEHGSIGTSSIAHRKFDDVSWTGLVGYGHDWKFIQQLLKHTNFVKIQGGGYAICHIPNQFDC